MGTTKPLQSGEETTRLLKFFAAFGIPTEHMRASPGIVLEDGALRLEPEFIWRIEDLTDEQIAAIENTVRVRVERP
jgi:hypothetical protein